MSYFNNVYGINAGAALATESAWINGACPSTAPPDLIITSSNFTKITPFVFSGLVFSALNQCGQNYATDCTDWGMCMATLDSTTSGTGFESYLDSFSSNANLPVSQWTYPKSANGGNYCYLLPTSSSASPPTLLLASSAYCLQGIIQCGPTASSLLVYPTAGCQGSPTSVALNANTATTLSSALVAADFASALTFQVSTGTVPIRWTTYFDTLCFVPGSVQYVSAYLVYCAALLLFFWSEFRIVMEHIHYKKQFEYIFFAACVFGSLEITFIVVSLMHCGLNIDSDWAMPSLIYNQVGYIFCILSSGISTSIATMNLTKTVLKRPYQKYIIWFLISMVYIFLAAPYTLAYVMWSGLYASNAWVTWMDYSYFNLVSFPGWQVFILTYEPLTIILIMGYIIHTYKAEEETYLHFAFLKRYRTLAIVFCVVAVNFLTGIMIQILGTDTFQMANDYNMSLLQIIYCLEHSINVAGSIELANEIPRMMAHMSEKRASMIGSAKRGSMVAPSPSTVQVKKTEVVHE